MAQDLFIGVDGGGTGCRARIRAGDGTLLGEGQAGPANAWGRAAAALEAVVTACGRAARAAGLDGLGALTAGVGLAGLGQAADRQAMMALPHPFRSLTLADDATIACLGAHGGRDGAILIIGTGTCGLSLKGDEATVIGGRGFAVSDDGSGAVLGREAVRHCLLALDGLAPRTPLVERVLAAVGGSMEAAIAWARTARPADYAALAPVILAAAGALDPAALDLFGATVRQVERMILRLLATGAPAVALLGGLATPMMPWLAPPLRDRLVPPAADAVEGALLMARTGRGHAHPGVAPSDREERP